MNNSQDELIRAYAILKSLRSNISQINSAVIKETFVSEFHDALEKLTSIGIDVSEFRIPDSQLARIRDSSIMVAGSSPIIYTKERYVDKTYFLTKMDAVLGYFDIIMSPEPKRMGFRKPED